MTQAEVRRKLSEADALLAAAFKEYLRCKLDYEVKRAAIRAECPHTEVESFVAEHYSEYTCKACGAYVANPQTV